MQTFGTQRLALETHHGPQLLDQASDTLRGIRIGLHGQKQAMRRQLRGGFESGKRELGHGKVAGGGWGIRPLSTPT